MKFLRRHKPNIAFAEFCYLKDALTWAKKCKAKNLTVMANNWFCTWKGKEYKLVVRYYEEDGAWVWEKVE